MLAGHFGLAAIVKSRQPQLPLWALMLSAGLLDVVFLVFYFLGMESYKTAPGTAGGYGEKIYTADYSHSLVGALIISLVALILTWIFWERRNAFVVGAVVFSSWLLDFVTHRGDLAILPGDMAAGSSRIGLGLWNIPWAAVIIELALCLVGAYLYYHASMRMAVRQERQQGKTGAAASSSGYRQSALISTLTMLILLLGALAANIFIS